MTMCHSIIVLFGRSGIMPSKTFDSLSPTKKKLLETAALDEFSKHTYDQISINRIIQSIEMPRGSFYLYFNDKEDLYLYIINKYRNIFLDLVLKTMDKHQVDIIEFYEATFNTIIEYCDKGCYGAMFRQFFLGLNRNIEHKIIDNLMNEYHLGLVDRIVETFGPLLAYNKHEDVKDAIFILNDILLHALTAYYILNVDLDFIKARLSNQLSIVKNGIYKK